MLHPASNRSDDMPKPAKIKLRPLGTAPIKPSSSASATASSNPTSSSSVLGKRRHSDNSSTAAGAHLISQYHALLKYIAQAKADQFLSSAERAQKVKDLEQQLAALGGIDAYQNASLAGESANEYAAFNASKIVLAHPDVKKALASSAQPLRLLDVGALRNHYLNIPNLAPVAIDLRPQDSTITQGNLLTFQSSHPFDIVVLSLVVNFEGDPRLRGRMLSAARRLLAPPSNSIGPMCFVILPLACVENSRYLDCDMFNRMMESLGFALLEQKLTAKLAMFVYKVVAESSEVTFGRTLVRAGTTRNNFCIMLQPEQSDQPNAIVSKKHKKAKQKNAEQPK